MLDSRLTAHAGMQIERVLKGIPANSVFGKVSGQNQTFMSVYMQKTLFYTFFDLQDIIQKVAIYDVNYFTQFWLCLKMKIKKRILIDLRLLEKGVWIPVS